MLRNLVVGGIFRPSNVPFSELLGGAHVKDEVVGPKLWKLCVQVVHGFHGPDPTQIPYRGKARFTYGHRLELAVQCR